MNSNNVIKWLFNGYETWNLLYFIWLDLSFQIILIDWRVP